MLSPTSPPSSASGKEERTLCQPHPVLWSHQGIRELPWQSDGQNAQLHAPKGAFPSQAETPKSLPKPGPQGRESCKTLLGERGRLKGLSRDVYKRVRPSSVRGTRKWKGFSKRNLRCLLRFSEDLAGFASARDKRMQSLIILSKHCVRGWAQFNTTISTFSLCKRNIPRESNISCRHMPESKDTASVSNTNHTVLPCTRWLNGN